MLSDVEVFRYSRQIMVNEIGGPGQQKLKAANVLVVGAGGLGSPVLLYLAAAGAGRITVSDDDTVDVSNLNRQILFGEDHLGERKSKRAVIELGMKNEQITVLWEYSVTPETADDIVNGKSIVIDCTDNYPTRTLLNQACARHGVPLLSAAVAGWTGQISLHTPDTACYDCWSQPPKDRDPCGVLGAMAGIVGTMAASEAIKFIVGAETPTLGRLLILNGLTMEITTIDLPRDAECSTCATR